MIQGDGDYLLEQFWEAGIYLPGERHQHEQLERARTIKRHEQPGGVVTHMQPPHTYRQTADPYAQANAVAESLRAQFLGVPSPLQRDSVLQRGHGLSAFAAMFGGVGAAGASALNGGVLGGGGLGLGIERLFGHLP